MGKAVWREIYRPDVDRHIDDGFPTYVWVTTLALFLRTTRGSRVIVPIYPG